MDTINLVNNGKPYFFRLDIAKESGQIARFTDWIKTRVSDNGKKVPIQWYDQGTVMNVHGFYPFIEGGVGKWIKDDDTGELVPSTDVVYRTWQGTPDDTSDNGIAYYTLEDQFFTKQGEFVGAFGLRDDNGNNLTSVNLVFSVLGNDLRLTQAKDYYIKDLENLKRKFENDGNVAIQNLSAQIEAGTETDRQTLDALRSSIQANYDGQKNLSERVAGVQQQIDMQNIVTKQDFAGLSNQITQQITQMKENGLEFFKTADDLRSTYPKGANKLCVTLDNSHQWVYDYTNNQWNDAGAYNYSAIDPQLNKAILSQGPDNLIPNSKFETTDLWTIGRTTTDPSYYIEFTDHGNALVMNGYMADNSNNESWATTQPFSITNVDEISFGVEIAMSGVDYSSGSNASIEFSWQMPDGSVQYYHRDLPSIYNDGNYHKFTAQHIVFPVGNPQTMRVGIVFYGNGQVKFRRPHANFGPNLFPYSSGELFSNLATTTDNLLAGQDLLSWDNTNLNGAKVLENSDGSVTIDGSTKEPGQYAWINSQSVKVNPKLPLSVDLIASTQMSEGYGTYVEFAQFDSNMKPISTISRNLPMSPEMRHYSLANIQLDSSTVFVQMNLTIKGQSKLTVNNVSISQTKELIKTKFPTNWIAFNPDPKTIVSSNSQLTYHGKPVTKLESSTGGFNGITTDLIPVTNTEKLSLKVIASASVDRSHNNAFIEVSQYDSSRNSNSDLNIDLFIPDNSELQKFIANNISLDQTTKYIAIKAIINGSATLNIGDIDYKLGSDFETENEDNLFENAKLSQGITYSPELVKYDTGSVKISTRNLTSAYSIWFSPMIRVDGGTTIKSLVRAKVALLPNNQGTAYYEIQQFDKYYSKVDSSKNIDNQFSDTQNNIQDFEFVTKLSSSTHWIRYALVVNNNADLQVEDVQGLYVQPEMTDSKSKLPRLLIHSKANISDKWSDTVPVTFVDGSRTVNAYLQYAMQGDSSRSYPKKNLKVKFFSDSAGKNKLKWKPKSSWTKNSKFNIKANYIDVTQARNLVNGQIVKQAYAVTPIADKAVAKKLLKTQSLGQMEGFPIELYFDDGYYGLMTFNIKKDDKTFGMDSDNATDEVITSETPSSNLDNVTAKIDGSVYGTEIHDSASEELNANWTKFLTFINTSSDTDFKSKLSDYLDLNSIINVFLFGNWSHEWDYYNKSILFLTWDSGKSYFAIPYDLDSTWNLMWNGSAIDDDLTDLSWINGSNNQNKLLHRLYDNFKPEIKAQWEKLRSGVWQTDKALNMFKTYIDSIPESAYEKDQQKWPDIPSAKITDYGQIQQSIIERGNAMDKFMEGLK